LSYPHFFRSAAVLEVSHALDHYALNVPHKLADLEAAVIETIGRITNAPARVRERELDIRCAFVSGFPYQVWYVWHEVEQVVEVVAFLHARQNREVLRERQ
jgi:hypothetical protein